jgi:CubicO group peptidase (beta-lactamase class C family)
MRTRRLVALVAPLVVLGMVLSGCGEKSAKWPTESWENASPEAAGLDSARLADAFREMRARNLNIHSLLIVRHGRLVFDADFYPYDGAVPHNLASVTKSVMTTLVAIAADQGKLDLDKPALSYFPGRTIANRDPRKDRITVRHLAAMTSGLDCVGEHGEPTLHQMDQSPDWVQFTLDLKMAAEPGTVFSYCSPGMHLLSAILQSATGMTALDFAKANLFAPLGIKDVIWPADPQGVTRGWGDLHLYPRDAAKIGYLWLKGGMWDGKRIVSKEWVEQSSRAQTKTGAAWRDDYGYGWWVMTGEEIPQYAASGRGGQRIAVFPTLDTIAVTTAGGIDPGDALELVAGALANPDRALAANPAGEDKLKAALTAIALPPEAGSVPELPPIAHVISGKTYRFPPNPLQMDALRLDFDGTAEGRIAMTFADGQPPRTGPIGLDGVYRMSPGENNMAVGIRGSWSEDAFLVEYDTIANIDAFDLKASFAGDRITISAKERTYEAGMTIEGEAISAAR